MAGPNWYVDNNRVAINWGTAVSGGKATQDIYVIKPEYNSSDGNSRQLWRANGQAVSAAEVTAAQADQSAAGIPVVRAGNSGNGGSGVTATAGANNGTTPPAPTISGSDRGGLVSCGSGAAPAVGKQVVVQFAVPKSAAPKGVTVSGGSGGSAALQPFVANADITANGFTISTNVAPAASQAAGTYSFDYTVNY